MGISVVHEVDFGARKAIKLRYAEVTVPLDPHDDPLMHSERWLTEEFTYGRDSDTGFESRASGAVAAANRTKEDP